MLTITNIYQPVVTSPAVRIDDAFRFNFATNNGLQRSFRAVRDYLAVNLAVTFEDAKNDGFAISTTATFAFDAMSPKERFIDFYLPSEGRLQFAELSQTLTDSTEKSV